MAGGGRGSGGPSSARPAPTSSSTSLSVSGKPTSGASKSSVSVPVEGSIKTASSSEARPGTFSASAKAQIQGPYHPRIAEGMLKANNPGETITSSTLPKPSQPNVRLAGQGKTLPDGTHLPFDARGFLIADAHAIFETRIKLESFIKGSDAHMREATRALREGLSKREISETKFTPKQLEAIHEGAPKIPGCTWHHHQDHGRMQLLPQKIHAELSHVGGMHLWGGKQ